MRFFHTRIELDSFLKRGDGLGKLLLVGIDDAELQMRRGKLWVKPEGFVEQFRRATSGCRAFLFPRLAA